VGGIGIMNIMLASITERIREIGIRKAVGASTVAIFVQIIIESVVIAMVGGVAGLATSHGLVHLLAVLTPTSNLPVITPQAMVAAFSFSVVIGILAGLKECSGEFLGWTHADLQADPADVIKAVEIMESSANPERLFVKGLRRGRPLFDKVFTWGMSAFETLYLGRKLWDINAQPNLFHRSFYESWKDPPWDFSLDLYALYMARERNLELARFDVLFPERLHGHSRWNTGLASKWKFIKRTVDFSLKLKKGLAS